MEIYFCVSFSASCEADGIQIAVSFLRLQSPTVVSFVHHLKFWFLADNIASVWSKLFLLFLKREQSQHFSSKAVADLGQFYISRVLEPASFVLCLTREGHLGATLLPDLPLQSEHPSPILGAFCCLHPSYVPFNFPLLPSVTFP